MKRESIVGLTLLVVLIGIRAESANASRVNYIIGNDRYETSSMIANMLEYDEAILVNGVAMADGLSASGLSGAINGPVLLAEKNNIPNSIRGKLKSVNRVYIVGGTGVISSRVEEEINSMGIETIRLGGCDRYATSKIVANKVIEISGSNKIFYVNGVEAYADATSIAPVAVREKAPLLITNGRTTDYLIDSDNAYVIGGEGVMSSYFNSLGERIGGVNRFETNRKIIDSFFYDKTHVYLSNSNIFADAIVACTLKEPIVLIDNYSDKRVLAGAKTATALGGVNIEAVTQAKSYLVGDKVVFYSQHQDDETIFVSSQIVDAIEAVGSDNVYVVLVTDGTDSGVLKQKRYRNLTNEEKSTLRDNEFRAACNRLGVKQENIILLDEPEATWNYKSLEKKILEFENMYDNITHISHTYKYDIQTQHLQNGRVLYDLYKRGQIKECRFFARPDKAFSIPKDKLIVSMADSEIEREKVTRAAIEYTIDCKDMKREGIGYKSVKNLLDPIINSLHKPSYLHDPE